MLRALEDRKTARAVIVLSTYRLAQSVSPYISGLVITREQMKPGRLDALQACHVTPHTEQQMIGRAGRRRHTRVYMLSTQLEHAAPVAPVGFLEMMLLRAKLLREDVALLCPSDQSDPSHSAGGGAGLGDTDALRSRERAPRRAFDFLESA